MIFSNFSIINIIALNSFDFTFVVQRMFYSFAAAALIGTIGGLAWVKLHNRLSQFSKSYMTTIAAVLLLYSFVEYLNSNGAIACLAFGIIIGNSKRIFSFLENEKDYTMTPSAKFFFSEISFFVKTFFFVYLGLIINLNDISIILLGFLITLLLFLVRPLAVSLGNRNGKVEDKDRVLMEILTPKSLAAAVLAQLPRQFGIMYGEQFSTIVLSVIMFSILFSTFGVFLTEKGMFKGLNRILDLRKYKKHRPADQIM